MVENQVILDYVVIVSRETEVVVGKAVFFLFFQFFGNECEVRRIDKYVSTVVFLQQLRVFVNAIFYVFAQRSVFCGKRDGTTLISVIFEWVERGEIDAVVAKFYQQMVARWRNGCISCRTHSKKSSKQR